MAPVPPGEPQESPKPQPIGNIAFTLLITTATLCLLFILWRRADALRGAVSHQLKTWSRREGNIRLSEDDGPSAESFLEDTVYDADHEHLENSDERAIQERIERMRRQEEEAGQSEREQWQEAGGALRLEETSHTSSESPFSVGEDVEAEDGSRSAWENHKRGVSVSSEATVRA